MKLPDDLGRNAESSEIGMTVGSDQYWQVMKGVIRKLEEKFTATEISFGCTVQGKANVYNNEAKGESNGASL